MRIVLYSKDQELLQVLCRACLALEEHHDLCVVSSERRLGDLLRDDDVVAMVIDGRCHHGVVLRMRLSVETVVPCILIAGGDGVDERIALLRAGADDVVSRSFEVGELTARVYAKIRRLRMERSAEAAFLSFEHRLHFTPADLRLLATLQRRVGSFVSAAELWHAMWGDDMCTSRLRYHIFHLRQRLALLDKGLSIEVQRGHGYRLVGQYHHSVS